MCLILFQAGKLKPYSKGSSACVVELHRNGLQAKFNCWFINKNGTETSFQTQEFFVKRADS